MRGALMLSIDINHPDVEEFAKVKSDLSKVTGANISIKLNREFMKAVENDEDYVLRFPCNVEILEGFEPEEYDILEQIPGENIYLKKIKAKELWNTIVKQARDNAEPGLLFWDNILDYAPDGVYDNFKAVCTNPCGEIPMGAYDSCRLMCLNLYSFVNNPFTEKASVDYKKLYEVAYEQQRLMDDLVDLELEAIDKIIHKIKSDNEPESVKRTELELWEKIYTTGKAGRRTGSGITALADMLAALGLKYDSDKALEITDKVMKTKMEAELDCTIDLSILRGSFEGWDSSKEVFEQNDGVQESWKQYGNQFYYFLETNFQEQAKRMHQYGRRNISWSTIAPTGSVSILCQTSSGCEPVFMPFYMRRKKINPNDKDNRIDFTDDNGDTWQEFPVIHEKFKEWLKITYEVNDNAVNGLTKELLDIHFKNSPWYQSTANDIDWEYRLKMQEVLQKYTSHSISSTLNLPENISVDTVSQIYMKASQMGLKGVTIYREGSRAGVLVNNDEKKETFSYIDAPKRPKELKAEAHITKVNKKTHSVIIGLFDDKPYEIFITTTPIKGEGLVIKQKKGEYDFIQITNSNNIHRVLTDDMTDEQAAITRLVSTSLRHGADIKFIVEQLQKTPGNIFSFSKGLARVLKKYIPDGAKSTLKCEDCGSKNVIFEEGCNKCLDCGSSKCS